MKKNLVRILCLLLCLAMLLPVLPQLVGAQEVQTASAEKMHSAVQYQTRKQEAEEELILTVPQLATSALGLAGTFALNESKTVTLATDTTVTYAFTAPETANYVLYNDWESPLVFVMYDQTVTQISEFVPTDDHYATSLNMIAGQTYYIEVYNPEYSGQTETGVVTLIKNQPLQSFSLGFKETTWFLGDMFYVGLEINPEMAFYNYTWSVTGSATAEVEYYGSYCLITPHSTGDLTLTVTGVNGQTESALIHVRDVEAIQVQQTKKVSLRPHEVSKFKFVPAESGNYAFYQSNNFDLAVYAMPEDHSDFESTYFTLNGYFGFYSSMKAGKTYYLYVENYDETLGTVTGTVRLDRVGQEIGTGQFLDVTEQDFFHDSVQWAVDNDITKGYGVDHIFAPYNACTRGQIVTFLWRAAGQPEPASSENPFKDVKSTDFFYKAVLWAVEQGITTGLSAKAFGPNDTCTRGQVATFLYRYANSPESNGNNPFKDVVKGEYYYDAVLWAVEAGVTTGLNARTFGPNEACTRGQIVTFLYRAMTK